ncbi:MAG: DNA-directed DNA polymerase II small subunit [Halobacteriaceae archaeon]
MPPPGAVEVVKTLTSRGYNADQEAVVLLANAEDTDAAIDRAIAAAPEETLTLTVEHVRTVLDGAASGAPAGSESGSDPPPSAGTGPAGTDGNGSGRAEEADPAHGPGPNADGLDTSDDDSTTPGDESMTSSAAGLDVDMPDDTGDGETEPSSRSPVRPTISGDITGRSTGTGTYEEFVSVFRDRYERLSEQLRGRVKPRPTDAVESMSGGSNAALVGMVNDIRSTASGHWLVELEDTSGVFPTLVLKDRDIAPLVDELLLDEVIGVQGTLADDGGVLFVDSLHFPDVPRTYRPSTADRHVQAALVSDVHVGSDEFMQEAWSSFADWLHTEEAEHVEYLLIAGDMVEGVGVYPDQDDELEISDIYSQYERFSELLKEVPGDLEIVMIPGNHDAVRLAEPQPGFDEEFRELMRAHDAQIVGNPATVTIEGVDILMYHGVSLDDVVAELPGASYEAPAEAMQHLLKKRHLAPTYGGKNRLAPEERDHLVIDDIPDILHSGHVHKLGVGEYHGVRVINSGCWQAQTPFQRSVNIDPDPGFAPVVDLDTLNVTPWRFH